MPASEILVHDASDGRVRRLADDASLRVAGPGSELSGAARVERQPIPPFELRDVELRLHLLVVMLSPPDWMETGGDQRARSWRPRAGELIFRPAATPHDARWRGHSDTLQIALDPGFVAGVAGDRGDELRWRDAEIVADPVMLHLARALESEVAAGSPGGRLVHDSLCTALASHLIATRATVPTHHGVRVRALRPRELRALADHVDADPAAPLSLAELAGVVHLSPAHFSRCFRAATGTTPHAWVMDRRVREARRLFAARPELTADEVARRCGFAGRSHLARRLRRA